MEKTTHNQTKEVEENEDEQSTNKSQESHEQIEVNKVDVYHDDLEKAILQSLGPEGIENATKMFEKIAKNEMVQGILQNVKNNLGGLGNGKLRLMNGCVVDIQAEVPTKKAQQDEFVKNIDDIIDNAVEETHKPEDGEVLEMWNRIHEPNKIEDNDDDNDDNDENDDVSINTISTSESRKIGFDDPYGRFINRHYVDELDVISVENDIKLGQRLRGDMFTFLEPTMTSMKQTRKRGACHYQEHVNELLPCEIDKVSGCVTYEENSKQPNGN